MVPNTLVVGCRVYIKSTAIEIKSYLSKKKLCMGFIVPIENFFSRFFLWRHHHYRWRAANRSPFTYRSPNSVLRSHTVHSACVHRSFSVRSAFAHRSSGKVERFRDCNWWVSRCRSCYRSWWKASVFLYWKSFSIRIFAAWNMYWHVFKHPGVWH